MNVSFPLSARTLGYALVCATFACAVLMAVALSPNQMSAPVAASSHVELSPFAAAEPPRLERHVLQPLTRDQAAAINEARPVVPGAVQPALPFKSGYSSADSTAYGEALRCLTTAVYFEAAGEPVQGQKAVAQVVLNRVRHPAFPATVCGVVYQGSNLATGCQFTFVCDGSLAKAPSRSGWERARLVAERALAGQVSDAVGLATHYHANWVVPYWAPNLDKIANVGHHIFYRWRGSWGRRQAFSQHYAGENAERPQLRYNEDFLASWDESVGGAARNVAAQDGLLAGNSPTPSGRRLNADEPAHKILADGTVGSLVADEHAAPPVQKRLPESGI